MDNWISVETAMPEFGETVLGYIPGYGSKTKGGSEMKNQSEFVRQIIDYTCIIKVWKFLDYFGRWRYYNTVHPKQKEAGNE